MELPDEAYRVIADALTAGQGAFSEEDFKIACSEIMEAMVRAEFAALALDGKLTIMVENGEVKYGSTAGAQEDLERYLTERGISREQLNEELRRGGPDI